MNPENRSIIWKLNDEFLILLILCLSSFSWEIIKRFRIVLKGSGSLPFDNFGPRIIRVFNEFFLQKKVLQQRFIPGLMHAFVFWGFMAFSLITIDHFSRGYNLSFFSDNMRWYYGLIFGLPTKNHSVVGPQTDSDYR